jgi:hypothetical protein
MARRIAFECAVIGTQSQGQLNLAYTLRFYGFASNI